MAFSADSIFYVLWRILNLSTLVGVGIYLVKAALLKRSPSPETKSMSVTKRLVLFSILAFAIQAVGLWLSQGTRNIMPQGRYFFPLILPITFLVLIGFKTLFGLFQEKAARLALGCIAILLFIFSSYCIWNYLIPVFHMSVKSPYTGV